jgi:hypothetical protein
MTCPRCDKPLGPNDAPIIDVAGGKLLCPHCHKSLQVTRAPPPRTRAETDAIVVRSIIPRCKTCAHHAHVPNPEVPWGHCTLLERDVSLLVNAGGGPEYFEIETHENFGCVEHKPEGT